MTELKSCPFCGRSLEYIFRWMKYHHPDSGECILDGWEFPDCEDETEKWNTRKTEPKKCCGNCKNLGIHDWYDGDFCCKLDPSAVTDKLDGPCEDWEGYTQGD